jgi:ABC-2 type transport system ATP-binding protein
MTLSIDTASLSKSYGSKTAVRSLDLQVEQGEVFGFLGPNGAGKTTSVKMLLGLVQPTAGTGRLLGAPLGDTAVRSRVGFLPEHFRFHDWLTAGEFMHLHGELHRIPAASLHQRSIDLLERVGLEDFTHRQLRTFSKGMLQRIGLAQALLNKPRLVFLDEPTSGLDPVGRRLVRDMIAELRQDGATVFLNSHLLSEVEITCDRVAFIKNGEVLQTSPLNSLIEGEIRLSIKAELSPETLSGLVQFGRGLRTEPPRTGEGLLLTLYIDSESIIPEISSYLTQHNAKIYAITPERLSLEELFLQVVGTDGGL